MFEKKQQNGRVALGLLMKVWFIRLISQMLQALQASFPWFNLSHPFASPLFPWVQVYEYVRVCMCVCTLLLHLVSMLQKPRHGGNPSGTSSFLISLATLHAPPWDMSSWSPAISSVPSMSQTLAPLHLSHLIIKIGLWYTDYISNIQLNNRRLGVQESHSWGAVISRFRLKSHWFQSTKFFLYIMPSGIDKGLRV